MDPVLFALLFHCVIEINWFSSGGSDDFLSDDFATGTVQGYLAEILAPVKRQNIDDGPAVLEFAPAIEVNWLPGVAGKAISDVDHDNRRYRVDIDSDEGLRADVPDDIVDDLDDVLVQSVLWEGVAISSFTADDCSVADPALVRLSKTAPV